MKLNFFTITLISNSKQTKAEQELGYNVDNDYSEILLVTTDYNVAKKCFDTFLPNDGDLEYIIDFEESELYATEKAAKKIMQNMENMNAETFVNYYDLFNNVVDTIDSKTFEPVYNKINDDSIIFLYQQLPNTDKIKLLEIKWGYFFDTDEELVFESRSRRGGYVVLENTNKMSINEIRNKLKSEITYQRFINIDDAIMMIDEFL